MIAALLLVEAIAMLKLDRPSETAAVVLACFAIGLGAALTPVGEPLGTIAIASLSVDFWYRMRLLGPLVVPGNCNWGLLEIVWMNFRDLIAGSRFPQGFAEFPRVGKLGMNWRWEESGGWWMCTASPHFVRGRRYVGCLAIQGSASYGLSGGEKNFVRSL